MEADFPKNVNIRPLPKSRGPLLAAITGNDVAAKLGDITSQAGSMLDIV